MFTGIVEEVGHIEKIRPRAEGREIVIAAKRVLADARKGDSIAVDGCCLTVESFSAERFIAFGSSETLQRSTLGGAKRGTPVNLERALALGGRLGGHLVQGHVDGLGRVARLVNDGAGWTLEVELPPELHAEMIPKGSIAIQGISLTIATLTPSGVTAAVIPETYEQTSLRHLSAGDSVNIEADVIGKYVKRHVENLLAGNSATTRHNGKPANNGGVTEDVLRRAGFM